MYRFFSFIVVLLLSFAAFGIYTEKLNYYEDSGDSENLTKGKERVFEIKGSVCSGTRWIEKIVRGLFQEYCRMKENNGCVYSENLEVFKRISTIQPDSDIYNLVVNIRENDTVHSKVGVWNLQAEDWSYIFILRDPRDVLVCMMELYGTFPDKSTLWEYVDYVADVWEMRDKMKEKIFVIQYEMLWEHTEDIVDDLTLWIFKPEKEEKLPKRNVDHLIKMASVNMHSEPLYSKNWKIRQSFLDARFIENEKRYKNALTVAAPPGIWKSLNGSMIGAIEDIVFERSVFPKELKQSYQTKKWISKEKMNPEEVFYGNLW